MPTLLRRWVAAAVAALIALGPLATPAYAGLTPLGDQPLNIQNSAQPNIVLTVDDSTSMLDDFLPDYVISNFCRDGVGSMTAACGNAGATSDFTLIGGGKYLSPGYTFQQYNSPYVKTGTGGGLYGPSGPGAGCFPGSPPVCSGGIDPGALPGIATYPTAPATWPDAGKPYGYWQLWPAPAHSAAMNNLYYDPRITYDPPVDSAGASFDQMDAGHTSNWTQVPADPWASTITYVDLTGQVTIGMWCNSDWSLGLVTTDTTNPNYGKYCRVNGSGAAAFGTVTAAQGADYTYPWAPPGFVVSASPGAMTSSTYAAQKVTLNASLTGTATTANWAAAQDQKYFYENENIIWCDPTSPSWPQTGPATTQTCNNLQAQTCSALTQTCNKTPGSCNGYVGASCNGLVTGTCNGWATAGCSGGVGQCNNPPACNFGACNNPKAQVCNGTTQTCNNIASQTCSGPISQVCNLPGTQTCSTTVTYDPPGCNLLPPDPENPCTPTSSTTCTPNPGTCSIQTTKSCTQNSDCAPQPGLCNKTATSCMSASDCPLEGQCSSDGKMCTQSSDCALLGGTCSRTPNKTCTKDSDCPSAGTCSNSALFCLSAADCGQCNNPVGQACTSVAQCTQGSCNQKTCANGVNVCSTSTDCTNAGVAGPCTTKSCASNANCPSVTNGACVQGGAKCGSAAQCPTTPGHCSDYCKDGVTVCTKNSDCAAVGGSCGATPGKACNGATQAAADATCTKAGTCNNVVAACLVNVVGTPPNGCPEIMGTCAKDATVQCRGSSDCSSIGTCSFTSAACNSQVPCGNVAGSCSITLQPCTTPGVDLVNCPNVGKCSITGTTCTSNAACPSQPGPLSPSAATCTTPGVGALSSTTTLRQDAEGPGIVCRRNHQTSVSAGYSSGPYTYPSGKFLTPITSGNPADARYATDNCPATDHYANVPRHYWKAEVQWCDRKIATAGDQWLGYGTDASGGGTCQAGKDSTHIYPRFYQFGAAAFVNNYTSAAFQRVNLDISKRATAMYTHNWIDINGQPQTITRTFDEEMTNYANWFAYYHTRIQAVKTVTSLAFSPLDNTYRVGFHLMSNGESKTTIPSGSFDPATFVDVQNFDATQKGKWYTQLFAIAIPLGLETPTLNAMARIGDYFSPGGSAELTGATDPIILSCQKNWHMLFTDGFTNQAKPTNLVGDMDNTVPALPQPVAGLTTGAAWPPPFRENSTQFLPNAASDYSMKFWATDLRPSASFAANVADDNVPATAKDPATWQHLNFAALSLGTQGKLPVANQSLTENQLASGSLQWPVITPNCGSCTVANQPDDSGVDDLWHGAINGRGRFVNAQTATELKLGMGQILQDITNQAGARAGAGFTSGSISVSNHAVYIVTFQPGWAGTLTKVEIDTTTGNQTSTDWEAATQLSNQLKITTPDSTCTIPGSCPWFTNRKIFTVKDDSKGNAGSSVPFLWPNLSAAQQDSLAPGLPAVGQAVLEFLRGNPTNEGVAAGQFRVRGIGPNGSEDFLGDIVDSQAVYVAPPDHPFSDTTDPGYSGFVAAFKTRPARVYVGANDGMVHAFRDVDEPSGVGGSEAWSFIPHDLYRPDATGLGALSYQDGGLPAFRHHFYVDSTPREYDANFGGGDTDWHTMLIGGLGKGGTSYYALDISNPASVIDESTAAAQYLWTFTDKDMGYTYGKPFVTKTHATKGGFSDGQWVVVVPAGYNNVNAGCVDCGQGKIFFIDAKTGAKLKDLSTGVGDSNNPAGLAHIVGYTKDFHNQVVEQVYGGDLFGNFWRFDVSDSDPGNWTVTKVAELTDPSGNPQPVTTPPTLDVDVLNGVDRWVFVGTGRLLAPNDLTDSTIANQRQTFYAIRDGTLTTPATFATPLQPRTDLVSLTSVANGLINGLTSKPAKGWYHDLPAGQRIVTPPQAALSLVAYAGTSPQDNPCLTGEPATLYVRSFSIGQNLIPQTTAGFNPAEGGVDEGAGAVGLEVTVFTDSGSSKTAGPPDIRIAITTAAGTLIFQQTLTQIGAATSRQSWRLFGQ